MLGTGMRIYFSMYCRETLILGNSLFQTCFEGPRLSFADHLWAVSTDPPHQGRTSVNNLELSMQRDAQSQIPVYHVLHKKDMVQRNFDFWSPVYTYMCMSKEEIIITTFLE